MKPLTKALTVALIQVLIVSSLGAKLLYDRHTRPQAWFQTARYDPDLPIRGRYLSLQMQVNDSRSPEEIEKRFGNQMQPGALTSFGQECGSIVLRDGKPTAEFDNSPMWDCDNLSFVRWNARGGTRLRLNEQILFFIADTAKDPTGLPLSDELWVLATIPRKGPPRPITLGVKKAGETSVTPLDLH
jgi:hypothetical protein